jgi:hypothetical protein
MINSIAKSYILNIKIRHLGGTQLLEKEKLMNVEKTHCDYDKRNISMVIIIEICLLEVIIDNDYLRSFLIFRGFVVTLYCIIYIIPEALHKQFLLYQIQSN